MADVELDLNGEPITIHGLHVLFNTICGQSRVVIKNCPRETAAEVFRRIELAIIAEHEGRVRNAREA